MWIEFKQNNLYKYKFCYAANITNLYSLFNMVFDWVCTMEEDRKQERNKRQYLQTYEDKEGNF